MKKKLYFVHLFDDFSGSPRVLSDVIESLPDENVDKIIISSQHKGFLDKNKYKKYIVPYFRSSNKYFVLVNYCLSQLITFTLLSFLLLFSKIKGQETKVIVNTMLPFGAGLAGRFFSQKVVYYIHEVSIKPVLLKRILLKIADFSAHDIVYVSNYVKNEIRIKGSNSTHVVYNGIRTDFEILKNINNPEEKFKNKTVLFVGSLKDFKGIYVLLELCNLLPFANFEAALNCEERDFENFKQSNNIPENIKLYLLPEDLECFYEKATIVVNLSIPALWVETFGLTIVEGFAKGCPAVVPNVGGPLELIKNGGGISLDTSNVEELSHAISKLLGNYEQWKTMSDNALMTSHEFSHETFVKNINRIFD